MGLRALKADGAYVQQEPLARGTWVIYQPGKLVRCPAEHCGKGLHRAKPNTIVAVRQVGVQGRATMRLSDDPGILQNCTSDYCKAVLEVSSTLASEHAEF